MSPTAARVPLTTVEESKALASQAIEMLVNHGIPPSPVNYSVAYEYCGGTCVDLVKLLDEHLQKGKNLDEFLLQELYDRHIASDRFRHLSGMGNGLQNILQTLMQNLAEVGDGASIFGKTLEQNIDHLNSEMGPEALQAIAADMLSATREAQERNNNLQQRLESTRRETESLRVELEQHRREALVDPLTGLFNRRAMDVQLEEFMAQDASRPLSVVVVDIDHFKRINDSHGHAVGDVVIRNVAETMRKCIRGEDVAVRYGGEEFLVLLPDTPLDGAIKVAETIRARVESLRLVRRHDKFRLAPFTISLGVATRRHEDDRDSLFERADRALYQSKNAGRNRVTHEGCLL